jgi:hypothetical protein
MPSHCDNDRPCSSGRSQAIFTTCIATAGGKDRLAAAPRTIVESLQALLEEALDPLSDVLLRQADPAGDMDQRESLGDFEDGATPSGQTERGRRAAQQLLELTPLFGGQDDTQRRRAASHRYLLAMQSTVSDRYHDRDALLKEFQSSIPGGGT